MINEVILHIGTPKTGTSSLQNSLANFDDGRTFYAKFLNKNNNFISNHSNYLLPTFSLNKNFDNDFPDFASLGRKKLLHMLNEHLDRSDRERIIISAEGIFDAMSLASKKKLLEYLGNRCKKLVVICYVRDPQDYAKSMFQQFLKMGTNFIPNKINTNYKKNLNVFINSKYVNEIIVEKFDKSNLYEKCVVKDFCSKFDLKINENDIKKTNESLSISAVKIMYALNRSDFPSAGEVTLNNTRNQLANYLNLIYPNTEKISSNYFSCITDFSDIDYMKKTFDISFIKRDKKSLNTRDELDKYLKDLSEINLNPMLDKLKEHGIVNNYLDTHISIVIRIFLLIFRNPKKLRIEHKL